VRFLETRLKDVFEIHIEPNVDERGFFARTWCREEFSRYGLDANLAQCSISFNQARGTLRGMHFQADPHPEAKLVRCTRGAVYDVVLDLRRDSPTHKQWIGVMLTSASRNTIYVPQGCAHGFLTIENESEVLYQISEVYYPELARGVRWNDPAFQIDWPGDVEVISDRDRTYADFEEYVPAQ
jgi:dTDP-4-dehydrorhamnose 3,5-epimerase